MTRDRRQQPHRCHLQHTTTIAATAAAVFSLVRFCKALQKLRRHLHAHHNSTRKTHTPNKQLTPGIAPAPYLVNVTFEMCVRTHKTCAPPPHVSTPVITTPKSLFSHSASPLPLLSHLYCCVTPLTCCLYAPPPAPCPPLKTNTHRVIAWPPVLNRCCVTPPPPPHLLHQVEPFSAADLHQHIHTVSRHPAALSIDHGGHTQRRAGCVPQHSVQRLPRLGTTLDVRQVPVCVGGGVGGCWEGQGCVRVCVRGCVRGV